MSVKHVNMVKRGQYFGFLEIVLMLVFGSQEQRYVHSLDINSK